MSFTAIKTGCEEGFSGIKKFHKFLTRERSFQANLQRFHSTASYTYLKFLLLYRMPAKLYDEFQHQFSRKFPPNNF